MVKPAFVIEARDLPPLPLRNGLMLAATGPMALPAHATDVGLLWQSEVCGSAHLYPPACITPPYQAHTFDTNDGPVQAYPFTVYASEVCGIIPADVEDAKRRVLERLRIGEQEAIERALWGGGEGVTGVFETLQALGGFTTTLAATTNLTDAVALLEQQAVVDKYQGPLIIHARPRLAAYMSTRQLICSRRGDHRYTEYGSEVVFGAGYSGNLPDGTPPAATTEAIYITGRVHLWREAETFVSPPNQVLNRATNQRGVFAQRSYALAVECFAAATLVTRA